MKGRLSRLGSGLSVTVAVLLLVPLVAAVALWRWQAGELETVQSLRDQERAAVNAATLQTMTWANVDHRKADEYVEAVQKGSTGNFLELFKARAEFTKKLLRDNETVQVPSIPKDGAALLELDGSTAQVLVAVDATVQNAAIRKAGKGPQPRQFRFKVTLSRVDGRWLTSDLGLVDVAS